jgi:transcriptional regulator GlxA family with amidase domain
MSAGPGPAEIGIVVYPGVQLAAVHGLTDLFAIADRLATARNGGTGPALRVTHWQTAAGGNDGDVICVYDSRPGSRPEPQAVVIPPTLAELPSERDTALISEWLRARHSRGTVLASVCSGAFILAETGLLAGRPVSTHWSCAEELAARFPDLRVDAATRIFDGGDIITAGGFMAWIDLGLRVVNQLLGPTIGSETARFIAHDREVQEQRYLSGFSPKLSHGDAAVLRVQHWLHGRDARRVSLASMAAHAKLEKRTFLRRFTSATGLTPLEYCRRVRIARARELLEFSKKTLKVIAWEVGYNDPDAFARAFQKATGLSPGSYRRKHGVARQTSSAQSEVTQVGQIQAI